MLTAVLCPDRRERSAAGPRGTGGEATGGAVHEKSREVRGGAVNRPGNKCAARPYDELEDELTVWPERRPRCVAGPCTEREGKPTAGPCPKRVGKCAAGPCTERTEKVTGLRTELGGKCAAGPCTGQKERYTARPHTERAATSARWAVQATRREVRGGAAQNGGGSARRGRARNRRQAHGDVMHPTKKEVRCGAAWNGRRSYRRGRAPKEA